MRDFKHGPMATLAILREMSMRLKSSPKQGLAGLNLDAEKTGFHLQKVAEKIDEKLGGEQSGLIPTQGLDSFLFMTQCRTLSLKPLFSSRAFNPRSVPSSSEKIPFLR